MNDLTEKVRKFVYRRSPLFVLFFYTMLFEVSSSKYLFWTDVMVNLIYFFLAVLSILMFFYSIINFNELQYYFHSETIWFVFITLIPAVVFILMYLKKVNEIGQIFKIIKEKCGILSVGISGFVDKTLSGTYKSYQIEISVATNDKSSDKVILKLINENNFNLFITKNNYLLKVELFFKTRTYMDIPDIDEKYFLNTDRKDVAVALLSSQKTKEIINYIFKCGYESINFSDKNISVYKKVVVLENEIMPEEVKSVFDKLIELSVLINEASCSMLLNKSKNYPEK